MSSTGTSRRSFRRAEGSRYYNPTVVLEAQELAQNDPVVVEDSTRHFGAHMGSIGSYTDNPVENSYYHIHKQVVEQG